MFAVIQNEQDVLIPYPIGELKKEGLFFCFNISKSLNDRGSY